MQQALFTRYMHDGTELQRSRQQDRIALQTACGSFHGKRIKKRCWIDSCTNHPSYNVVDRRTVLSCEQFVKDNMVDARSSRSSHSTCGKPPLVSVRFKKQPLYCKQHTMNGVADVHVNRCLHDSCN